MAPQLTSPIRDVLTIEDLKEKANRILPLPIRDFYNDGSLELMTLRDNENAFNRYKLHPRVLRNVGIIDTSTIICNTKVSLPFGFSPSGMHQLAHPEGELATSRAAAKSNIAMALSCYSTNSLEDVIAYGRDNPYMMHVCFLKDRSKTLEIIQRAEAAGYKAILVSVDIPVLGIRLSERRNRFKLPAEVALPMLEVIGNVTPDYAIDQPYDPTVTWDEAIPWLRKNTKLEIWLKGVCNPDDIELAIQYGVDGVMISNHGGRQLDGVPASLDVLRMCGPVFKDRIKIAIDGGIRRGSDVFKALALDAQFVFLGRVPLWGLAYDGEEGVSLALTILRKEFESTMALCGCTTIAEISKAHLVVLNDVGLLCRL